MVETQFIASESKFIASENNNQDAINQDALKCVSTIQKQKMSDKFKNKYTIQSSRLQGYDYSQNGMYFVTICAKDKEHFFGEIENETMNLSDIGKIAKEYWQEISKHFPFVNLDEFVVMPNHLHGIIEIINNNQKNVETQFIASKSKFIASNNQHDTIN